MIIDSHVHLWRYDAGEYAWIAPEERVIQRDFLLPELHAQLDAARVDGVIAVQARQSIEETRALIALARRSARIHGVVGWVPLADPALGALLDELVASGQLIGVRHVVQSETDDGFLDRPAHVRGLATVARHGVSYDLLVRAYQMQRAIRCADANPDLHCVLDHLGKPLCGPGQEVAQSTRQWARDLRELARRPQVWCKLSGLPYEAGPSWTVAGLRPYLETALEAFGPRRLLFGSDWPVCLVRCGYGDWLAAIKGFIAELTQDERASILGAAARVAYRLDGRSPSSEPACTKARP